MNTAWNIHRQGLLESQLHSIFPNNKIYKNTRREVAIKNVHTHSFLEVDVWLPDLHLCFEFQDNYHYKPAWYNQIPLNIVQNKDDIKRIEVINNRLTLVVVPCWWDGAVSSLSSSINFQRPDMKLISTHVEIPCNPPAGFFIDFNQLMLASFPETYNNVLDNFYRANGAWWIGEKWDGVRCFYDTTDKQLYSRNNIKLPTNASNHLLFGNQVLDGELWCGRGSFNECQAIMASDEFVFANSSTRLLCFDEASRKTQFEPFETRYSLILSHVPYDHPAVINAPRFLCQTEPILQETLQNITGGGGEGVMLRKPLSLYLPGRSESLFKIKATNGDQEALVVKVEADGSLLLQHVNGELFAVDKKDCVLHRQAAKGDIVTVCEVHSPNEESSSVVVNRIRSDLSWSDVLRGDIPLKFSRDVNESSADQTEASADAGPVSTMRSWKRLSDRRKFLDTFAAAQGMDHLNPLFWQNVSKEQLLSFDKGFHGILYYGGKLATILTQAYPDIGLRIRDKQYKKNIKAQFDKFAAKKGKDPLNPSFWYNVNPREFSKFFKIDKRSSQYGRIFSVTLMQIYPNIGLQQSHFKAHQSWRHERVRRKFFEKFALAKGMDSLNPVFWYTVTARDLQAYDKKFTSIYQTYGGKLSTILTQLYPDIGLNRNLFAVHQSWKTEKSRKDFFEKFAVAKGMDSLNPTFWNTVTKTDLALYDRGYAGIARFYNGATLPTILAQLYPVLSPSHNSSRVSLPHT